jgi:hypothetical protein
VNSAHDSKLNTHFSKILKQSCDEGEKIRSNLKKIPSTFFCFLRSMKNFSIYLFTQFRNEMYEHLMIITAHQEP